MSLKKEIEKHEEKLISAMLSSDVKVLDQLLSDQLIFTDHLGRLINKTMDIEAHANGLISISSILPSEEKIQLYDDFDIVSVKMAIKGTYEGEPFEGTNRYTRIWTPKRNGWHIVAGHSSMITE